MKVNKQTEHFVLQSFTLYNFSILFFNVLFIYSVFLDFVILYIQTLNKVKIKFHEHPCLFSL